MSSLLQEADEAIRRRQLIRPRQQVLVAVSGGVDSMVLLHVLHELAGAGSCRWRLTVAHLNHQLRGRSSDADERLVQRTARELGLPVVAERADVRSFAQTQKLSVEMAARHLRHAFLARTAGRLRIPTVALAHHADDQVELFFIRLLRGGGGEGLAGMKWHNVSPEKRSIKLIRPLLNQSKNSLRQYAAEQGIRFREDVTNRSPDILRNRIRCELLPLLRKRYQPALDPMLLRMMDILGAEAEVVVRAAKNWLSAIRGRRKSLERSGVSAEGGDAEAPGLAAELSFEELPVAVQRRCLQCQLWELGIKSDFELIERLRLNAQILSNVPRVAAKAPLARLTRDTDGLVHLESCITQQFSKEALPLILAGSSGETEFAGIRILWQLERRRGAARSTARPGLEYFDADRVGEQILLRHWQPGDRFQPIGMKSAVKLQDLFVNQGIPRTQRHRLVVAATAGGELFWVEGLRMAERFKLTKTTIRRLHWVWWKL